MIQNVTVKNGFEVHIRHELEPFEVQALKELKEKGYLEFRGRDYNFEGRNTDLQLSAILPLSYYGYIEEDYDAWHTTYKLTEFGKKVVEELV